MPLYVASQLPECWVAEDESGALVMWPARSGGWAARTPYRGHRRALREVDASNAYGTGWPGAPGRGRPPRANGATKRIELRLTAAEREAWERAAGDRSLSEWIREACEAYRARPAARAVRKG